MRALRLCSLLVVSVFGVSACYRQMDAAEDRPAATTAAAAAAEPAAEKTTPPVAKDGAANAGCTKDSDCPAGHVCERCGQKTECAPGCREDDQCPKGERCAQVQCIRCPCPGQCFASGK